MKKGLILTIMLFAFGNVQARVVADPILPNLFCAKDVTLSDYLVVVSNTKAKVEFRRNGSVVNVAELDLLSVRQFPEVYRTQADNRPPVKPALNYTQYEFVSKSEGLRYGQVKFYLTRQNFGAGHTTGALTMQKARSAAFKTELNHCEINRVSVLY